jgi:D-glycero-D-manno-heptose 1,7-bisphosphate phosphatase
MKAVFLDRDGVVNKLIYYPEQGIIDSPFTVKQFTLNPGIPESINTMQEAGYLVILVSNQPGIAKGNLSREVFDNIRRKMNKLLEADGTKLDGEYYCLHHPEAIELRLRQVCACRKPNPGLLLQAAQEHEIDLTESWMIGDGITDVQAGQRAGCRTVLIGRPKCELCELMQEHGVKPDCIAPNLSEATKYILTKGEDSSWKSSLTQQTSTLSKNG